MPCLRKREYLRGRVDELEFAMDFTNRQVIKLQDRAQELEASNSQLEKELSQALQVPFRKREKQEAPENPKITFFHIDESRGSKVVIEHLGESYGGTLITDFWNTYRNKIPTFAKQKCLRHILGDIKELLDKGLLKYPKSKTFLEAVK